MQLPEHVVEFLRAIQGKRTQSGYTQLTYVPMPDGTSDPFEHKRSLWLDVDRTDGLLIPDELPGPERWQDYEWFFTPCLLQERRERRKDLVLEGSVLFCDFDTAVDLSTLNPQPSIVLETSPGKYHTYWLLQDPVTPQTVEELNYRLKEHYGADNTHDCSRLMRLPMGQMSPDKLTRKPRGPVVGLERFRSQVRYRVEDFDHLPQVSPSETMYGDKDLPVHLDEYGSTAQQQALMRKLEQNAQITARMKQYLTQPQTVRYRALMHIYSEGKRRDIKLEEMFHLVYNTPNDKWADNPHTHDKELWRDIQACYAREEVAQESMSIRERLDAIRAVKGETEASKNQKFGRCLIDDMNLYGLFIQTQDGRRYYRDDTQGKLVEIDKTGDLWTSYLIRCYGIDSSLKDFAVATNYALQEAKTAPVAQVYRTTKWDEKQGKLYINRYDGRVVVLNGKDITVISNGDEDVLFLDDPNAKAWTYERVDDTRMELWHEHVLGNLSLDRNTQNVDVIRHVAMTWIVSLFFRELNAVKPILFIHGVPGSGKTSFFKALNLVLRTGTYDVDKLPKDQGEFDRVVGQVDYLFMDNVDDYHNWLANALALLATQYTYSLRVLYTTQSMITTKVSCFVGLTSHAPKFVRSDVAERMIPIPVHFRDAFLDESTMELRTQQFRARLWGELLSYLNRMIQQVQQSRSNPVRMHKLRMANFATMLSHTCAISGVDEEACIKFVMRTQAQEAEGGDPVVYCLREWLERESNLDRPVTVGTLWEELTATAAGEEIRRNGISVRSLGLKLNNLRRHFENMGIKVSKTESRGSYWYKFEKVTA